MRCLLFTLLLSGSSAFMMAPAAVARPRSVVRAEKEGEAVAKKKGIPLALLIWPLIAVGDDVRGRVDKSTRVVRHRRARETTHRPQTRRSTSRKSSRASRSRASRRPRCPTRTRTTSRSKSFTCYLGRRCRRRRATSLRRSISLVNHTGLDHRPRRAVRRRSERCPRRRRAV